MFDNLKNLAGLAGIMKDLPRIKARMEQAKEELNRVRVQAESGGGAVRAIANGQLRIVSIHVDQAMISGLVDSQNPDDRTMAEDLIAGAVNAALEKARHEAERTLGEAARELNLPIPPGGLGGLLS
jgi:DNA-binding YbaB/EbfC family protein